MDLKPCPFCGSPAEFLEETTRCGYGEYERHETFYSVACTSCKASGRRYHRKTIRDFTRYTVADFRNNPILRAKVEDEHEAYSEQTKQLAIDAWNHRAGENHG